MSVDCKTFMEGYSDKNATDKEKLEYAQCVNDNVYLVNSNNKITENEPLMFGIIFVIIMSVTFFMSWYLKRTNAKELGHNEKDKKEL